MSGHRRRIVALSAVLPERGVDGSAAYLHAILDHLGRRGHDVRVLWTGGRGAPVTRTEPAAYRVDAVGGVRLGDWLVRVRPLSTLLRHLVQLAWQHRRMRPVRDRYRRLRDRSSRGRDRVRSRIPPFASDLSPEQLEQLRDAVTELRPDVLIANYAPMAAVIERLDHPRPLTIVITHDVWHERLEELGRSTSAAVGTAEGEAELLASADVVAAIQWDDAETFRRLVPSSEVIVTPMPVEVAPVPAAGDEDGAGSDPARALYVGSQAPTNVEGLQWFLDEVWPIVRRSLPAAELDVCGNVCRAIDDPPDGVTLSGRVDDLEPHYRAASLAVVPYLRGSGLKIKLVEALAHGLPAVATTSAVLGVHHLADECVLVVDDAAEHAAAVVSMLTDASLRGRLAAGARRAVERDFATEAAMRELVTAVESASEVVR